MEPDPKTAARIAALQKEMDAVYYANRTKAKRCRLCRIRPNRHTFLTEAGEYTDHTDPLTLQYVAGHDNIKRPCATCTHVRMRVEKLFVRLGNLPRPESRVECKRSVQNPVQLDTSSDTDLAKILSTWQLRRAEVVELADTPS
jgi:hypothetical protein